MSEIDDALVRYQDEVEKLIQVVRSLSEAQFLDKADGWSPRDVVAHLIGWNRYVIEAANASALGEVPQSFIDVGPDFCNVNAASVARFSSTDREELLAQLTYSFNDMADRLGRVTPDIWVREMDVPGVRFRPSVAKNVLSLIDDYAQHRVAIEQLLT